MPGKEDLAYLDYLKAHPKTSIYSAVESKDPNLLQTEESKFDKQFIIPDTGAQEAIQEFRAQRQPVVDKIANGIIQASGKAATSFINGTAGTIYGIGSALSNGQFSKLYDNEVTQSMDKLNEAISGGMPLYQTKEYQNMSLPEKLTKANLWWGDVLSGAGYTLGAVGTGVGTGMIYRGLAKGIGATGKIAQAGEALSTSIAASVGEAGDEGRSGGKQWYDKTLSEVKTKYEQLGQEVPQEVLADLQDKKDKLENTIFLVNLPIIAGSNFLQFGKTMTNLKAERKAVGELGEQVGKKIQQKETLGEFSKIELSPLEERLSKVAKIGAQPVEEGTQEQLQNVVQTATQDFYTKKFNHEDTNILDSTIKGLKEAYGTEKGWESFVIGALSTLVSGGATNRSALREAFKSDDPQIANALDILNKHNPKEVYKQLIQADNRSKSLSADISEAAAKDDRFEFNNAQNDLLTSYTLSRIQTGQYEGLKEDLESMKNMKLEEFEKTFGVTPEESNKQSVTQLVQDRINKTETIAKAYETVENTFKDFSEGNKERLIHAAVTIDDSKDRRKKLEKDLMTLTVREGSDLLVAINDQILANLPGSSKYEKLTDTEAFKKALDKINPLRKPEILSLVTDLEKLNKREQEYKKLFTDIVGDEQVRKANEELDKTNEQSKDVPPPDETETTTAPITGQFAPGSKIQFRGKGESVEIEDFDPENNIVHIKGDPNAHSTDEFYVPKTLPSEGKEILNNTDITQPYTGESKTGTGVHALGTTAAIQEILDNTPSDKLEAITRVRLTKDVSVKGNIQRGLNHLLNQLPSTIKATLSPNKTLDVVYELQLPTGEWIDAFHGRHSDQYVTVDEKGATRTFQFTNANKSQIKTLFDLRDDELTDDKLNELVANQQKLNQLNSIYQSIFNKNGDITLSAKQLKEQYGVTIYSKKGKFDTLSNDKIKPNLSEISKANIDGEFYIFDKLGVDNVENLQLMGDLSNLDKSKDLLNLVKNPNNFISATPSRYIALGREPNGEHFLFGADTSLFTDSQLSPIISDILDRKSISDKQKNEINDKINSLIHIISSKGTYLELKLDTKDELPSKLQIVESKDGKKTYYDIPLSKKTSINSIISNANEKGLKYLKDTSFRNSIPNTAETRSLKSEELANMFLSNVSKNVFKYSKIIVDIDSSINKTIPSFQKKETSIPIHENFRTWDLGDIEGKEDNSETNKLINYYIETKPDEKPPGSTESFNQFKNRVINDFKDAKKNAPTNTVIVTHSQILKIVSAYDFKTNTLDTNKYIHEKVGSGAIEKFTSEKGDLYLVRHGDTDQNKGVRDTPDLIRTKDAQLAEKGIQEAKDVAKELKKLPIVHLIAGPLYRTIQTAEIIKAELEPKLTKKEIVVSQAEFDAIEEKISNATSEEELEAYFKEREELERKQLEGTKTISESDQLGEQPINKLSSTKAQYFIDFPEAEANIRKLITPEKIVSFDDVNQVIDNLQNKGETWGFFKDKSIYLSKFAEKGTEYHEVFHYVFRRLQNDEQLRRLYLIARAKYGSPTIKQLSELKNQSNANKSLKKDQLEHLWLEEKMADGYMNYQLGKSKSANLGLIGKLYEKIKAFINWIVKSETELEALFGKINKGSFVNSDINISNQFSTLNNPVFKQIPNGKRVINDKENKLTYTGVEEGRKIIRTITAKIILKGVTEENKDTLIREAIAEQYNFNSVKANMPLILSTPSTERTKIGDKLAQLQFVYSNPESVAIIVDQVNKSLDVFNFNSEDFDDKLSEEENERKLIDFDRNAINIGGIGSLNTQIREYIGTTLHTVKDVFGREIQEAIDPQVVYQGIIKTLTSTNVGTMLNKLKIFADNNPQTKALYERLKADTGYDETLGIAKQNPQLLQNFVNAFTTEKIKYLQILPNLETGVYRVFDANNEGKSQVEQWEKNFQTKTISDKSKTALINAAQTLASGNISKLESIKSALSTIGIDVSDAYLKYSILSISNPLDELVSQFSEAKPLTETDLSQIAKLENPYDKGEKGAADRILKIAQNNYIFDENAVSPNFQDAAGETRYSYIQPSLALERSRELKQQLSTPEGRKSFKSDLKTKYSHSYGFNENNYLLNHENADNLFNSLQIEFTGDVRQDKKGQEGTTFKGIDDRSFKLMQYGLFASGRFYPKVLEASASAYSVKLPVESFYKNGRPTQAAINHLYDQFLQEVERIAITQREIENPEIIKVKAYHLSEINKEGKEVGYKGLKLFYFRYLESSKIGESIISRAKSYVSRADFHDLEEDIKTLIESNILDEIKQENQLLDDLGVYSKTQNLLPKEANTAPKDFIGNFYMNTLININAFNDLIELNPAFSKDAVDNVKRAKRWIASKINFGKGQHIVGFIKEPKAKGLTKDVDVADAQSYIDLNHFKFILAREGKLSTEVFNLLNKIDEGEDLTWDEILTLQSKGALLNSIKTVTSGPVDYHKMSDMILTKKLTSIKNDKGEWVARKDGKVDTTYLHNLRIELENLSRRATKSQLPDFQWNNNLSIEQINQIVPARILPESASKLLTYKPAELTDGKYGFDKTNTRLIENKYSGRQVDTPSGKTQIVYGTQLIQLIDSEQDDNTIVNFQGKDVKLGELRDIYQDLLSQARTNSVESAKKFLGKLVDGKLTEKEEIKFRKKLLDTLESSGADDSLLQFFGLDPMYNLNLPNTLNKYEQLFLAHFTKGVLSQKTAGLKLTLVSGNGFNVSDGKGSYRELKYVPGGLSEVAMPAFTRELHNLKPGDILNAKQVLEMFGQRIPTQDKHSMIAFKVVEFLPSEYGSIGIFPKEVIELSGADFDIDSIFVERKDYYGDFKLFGSATTIEGKFNEFIKDNSQNNKDFKKIMKSNGGDVEASLKALQLPSNLEEFKKETKGGAIILSNATINNQLVDANIAFLTNDKMVEKGIPQTPASVQRLSDVRDKIQTLQGIDITKQANLNSPVGQFKAWKSNSTGKENVGPAANANLVRAFLAKFKVHLSTKTFRPNFNRKKFFDFSTHTDALKNRIQDTLSTILSAMTDNAKDPIAGDLNLSLTSLGPVLQLVSSGVDLYDAILLINQPIVKEYTEAIERTKTVVKSQLDQEVRKKDIKDNLIAKYKLTSSTDLNITTKELEDSIGSTKTEAGKYLEVFTKLEEQGKYWQHLSKLLALNKGLPSSFKDTQKIKDAIEAFKIDSKESLSEDAPFDIRTALEGTHIKNNIKLFNEIMDMSKQYFITQTPIFTKTIDEIESSIKDNIRNKAGMLNDIKLDFLSYLTIDAYKKNINRPLNQNLLTGPNSIVDQLHKLPSEIKENKLIKFLSVDNKTTIPTLIANTRIKLSGSQIEELTESFRELFNNEQSNQFARNLFEYLIVKDGMQFKNNSFIKFISPFMFTKISESLNILGDEAFKGQIPQELANNFKNIWFRHVDNKSYISTLQPSKGLSLQKENNQIRAKSFVEDVTLPEYTYIDKTLYKAVTLDKNTATYEAVKSIGNELQSPYGFTNAEEVSKNAKLDSKPLTKISTIKESKDSKEITSIIENKTSKEILENILNIEGLTTKQLNTTKWFLSLLNKNKTLNVKVREEAFTKDDIKDDTKNPDDVDQFFDPKTNTIHLSLVNSTSVSKNQFVTSFLHEIYHSFTVYPFYKKEENRTDFEKEFVNNITNLYNQAKSNVTNTKDILGYESPEEFIAEIQTNNTFRSQVSLNDRSGFAKVFEAIRRFFNNLFGKVIIPGKDTIADDAKSFIEDYINTLEKVDVGKNLTNETRLTHIKEEQSVTSKEAISESAYKKQYIYFARRLTSLQNQQSKLKEGSEKFNELQKEITELEESLKKTSEDEYGTLKALGEVTLSNAEGYIRDLEEGKTEDSYRNVRYSNDVLEAFEEFKDLAPKAIELKNRLFPFIQKLGLEKINEYKTEDFEITQELVDKQDHDISILKEGVGSLRGVNNYIARTIGLIIGGKQNKVSTARKHLKDEIEEELKTLTNWGSKNGLVLSKIWDLFSQKHNGTLVLAKPLLENGKPNPDYKKIQSTPELKRFYDYYQQNIIKYQDGFPYKPGKYFIPNLHKNTLSNFAKNLIKVKEFKEGDFIGTEGLYADILSQKFIQGIEASDKSNNLADALLEFAHHSNSYNELSEVLPEVRILQEMLLHKIDSRGNIIPRELIKASDPTKKVVAEKSNINSMIDKWVDIQIKGNTKDPNWQIKVGQLLNEEGETIGYKYIHGTEMVDLLIKTNSLVKIGLSPVSALSNVTFGQIANIIEAGGGQFFGLNHLHFGNTIFWKQTFDKNSTMNKLLEEFNLLREQDDYELAKNPELKGKLSAERLQQIMYAPQKMGEKWNQATTVLAVMIKDGYMKKNGDLTEKWNNATEKERDALVNKTQRINSMTHGRYSQQEAATASQKVWFRAVSQFRKWIFSMYEARFDKKQYDVDLQTDIEGRLRTLGRLILNFSDTMERLKSGKLTDLEKYNMKKNLTEVILWAATFFSYTLLMGGDDDKKRRKNPIAKLGITLLQRAAGDLDFFYSPNQIANLSANAIPVGKFVTDITKAIEYIPYAFDYNNPKSKFRSGLNKGKNKELVQLTKISPALNALLQAENVLNENAIQPQR